MRVVIDGFYDLSGKYFRFALPIIRSDWGETQTFQFMAQERSNRKFKSVRHVKARGDVYVVSERLKANLGVLVTSDYQSGQPPTMYHFARRGGGIIPPVPSQYASRVASAEALQYSVGFYADGYGGERGRRYVFWVNPDGAVPLWAVNSFSDLSETAYAFYTRDPRDRNELTVKKDLAEAYAYLVFKSTLPLEVKDRQSQLVPDLLDQMKSCTVNQWEFLQDVNLLQQVLDVGKKVLTFDESDILKSLSDLYLTYSFGASNTARDYRELARSISTELERYARTAGWRAKKVRSRSSGSIAWLGINWSANYNLLAFLDAYEQGVMGLFNRLDRWGLYPDQAAIWEIVPWSFVVDWFLNVKENLRRHDAAMWREYFNVHASIRSVKLTGSLDLSTKPSSSLAGVIDISLYERTVEQSLPVPKIDFDLSLPRHIHQWVSGAALVIQRS